MLRNAEEDGAVEERAAEIERLFTNGQGTGAKKSSYDGFWRSFGFAPKIYRADELRQNSRATAALGLVRPRVISPVPSRSSTAFHGWEREWVQRQRPTTPNLDSRSLNRG